MILVTPPFNMSKNSLHFDYPVGTNSGKTTTIKKALQSLFLFNTTNISQHFK